MYDFSINLCLCCLLAYQGLCQALRLPQSLLISSCYSVILAEIFIPYLKPLPPLSFIPFLSFCHPFRTHFSYMSSWLLDLLVFWSPGQLLTSALPPPLSVSLRLSSHGSVQSAAPVQSGIFEMPLPMLSLTPTENLFKHTFCSLSLLFCFPFSQGCLWERWESTEWKMWLVRTESN